MMQMIDVLVIKLILVNCLIFGAFFSCESTAFVEKNITIQMAAINEVRRAYETDLIRAALETTKRYKSSFSGAVTVVHERRLDTALSRLSDTRMHSIIPAFGSYRRGIKKLNIPHFLVIRHGLMNVCLSVRQAIVHRDLLPRILEGDTLESLKLARLGMMAKNLEKNLFTKEGFNVITSNFGTGFEMLEARRFDYLLYPAVTATLRLQKFGGEHSHFAVVPHVFFKTFSQRFIVVSGHSPELAGRIEAGLNALEVSGEAEKIKMKHFGELMSRMALPESQVVVLPSRSIQSAR